VSRLDEFIAVLRKARQERPMTQQQVADRLGVAQPTVGNWEVLAARPSDDSLHAWAGIFGIEVPDGVEGWRTASCGTTAGYERHRSRHEQTCGPCRLATKAARRARRAS
jgi:transcriptional regulator with XRE-family HTH domain